MQDYDTDFIIIGSGFGGSVAALRLRQKGFNVILLEQGKRFTREDLPQSTQQIKHWYFFPKLKLHGFFSMHLFKHMLVLHGNAFGGGSITYAATLLQPPSSVWQQGTWANLQNWAGLMPQFYLQAEKILGVTTNQQLGWADSTLRDLATAYGVGHSFYTTKVGIYFGDNDVHSHPPIHSDPYFHGQGPARSPCIGCGGCMVGCRYGAKNTLDYNYLYLAEKLGTDMRPESRVTRFEPISEDGQNGYLVHFQDANHQHRHLRSRGLVLSAGTLGSLKLLFEMQNLGLLPHLSPMLGQNIYTNAEAIVGIRHTDDEHDYSQGIAIGSGIYLNPHTHIEATRYPKGSDTMGWLMAWMNPSIKTRIPLLKWLLHLGLACVKQPRQMWHILRPRGFAQQCMIFLCMQTLEHSLSMGYKRSIWGKRLYTYGAKIPSTIPEANAFTLAAAKLTGGTAMTSQVDVLLNIPVTAHCMGGCALASTPEQGVCDGQHRVFGYQHFYICDGSNISSNLGVNPSLTITALTEAAMSHIPDAEHYPWSPA